MDGMIDTEESCIYCSKYLYGLNDFNKRMHIETCKVRRLVESSFLANHHQSAAAVAAAAQHHLQAPSSSSSSCSASSSSSSSSSSANTGALVGGAHHVNTANHNNNNSNMNNDEYMMIGDNCPYCFKNLKDVKTNFNKAVHVKCCKLRKETNDHRGSTGGNNPNTGGNNPLSGRYGDGSGGGGGGGGGLTSGGMNSALAAAAAAAAHLNLNLNYQQHAAAAAAVASANATSGSGGTVGGGGQNSLSIGDLANMGAAAAAMNQQTGGGSGVSAGQSGVDACLFCNKPLSNLNEFNKKMHLENCKTRKSLEGNVTPKSKKDDSSGSKNSSNSHLDTIDLGLQCMYCSRSFANLSNFNKRLHFEHCKVKKRKLRQSISGAETTSTSGATTTSGGGGGHHTSLGYSTQGNNSMIALSQNNNAPLNLSLLTSHHHHHQQQQQQQQQQAPLNHHHSLFKQPTSSGNFNTSGGGGFNVNNNSASQQAAAANSSSDLGDSCLFCARSLLNLSNFNKRVHIETCKVKQVKKETTNRLKQINKTIKKKPVVKKDKPSMNSLLHFSNVMMNNMDMSNANESGSAGNQSGNPHQQQQQLNQYDALNSSLNLGALDTSALQHHSQLQQHQAGTQNLLNSTAHLQLQMDPNVTTRLFI